VPHKTIPTHFTDSNSHELDEQHISSAKILGICHSVVETADLQLILEGGLATNGLTLDTQKPFPLFPAPPA
jgi:hypothetical protein